MSPLSIPWPPLPWPPSPAAAPPRAAFPRPGATDTDDPIADHKALECTGFSRGGLATFKARWRARPVIRVRTATRSLVSARGADDQAMMWLLRGANEGDRLPIVLAAEAYASPNSARDLALADALSGVFDLVSPAGRRLVMDRSAWVTPIRDDPDTFIVSRTGLVRGWNKIAAA